MRHHLPALLATVVGAAGLTLPVAATATTARPASVCSLASAHRLVVTLAPGSRMTVSREHGAVHVSGKRCTVKGGRPVRVRDLTRMDVRIPRSRELTAETVRFPDLVSWRTDHPAGVGTPRVRVRVDLGYTDLVSFPDDNRPRYDRVEVAGTAGPDSWTLTQGDDASTISFDASLTPDVRLGEPIVSLETRGGPDTVDLIAGDGAGPSVSQPVQVHSGPGADTVRTRSVSLESLELGNGDDRAEISSMADNEPGSASVRPGMGDDEVDVTHPTEVFMQAEARPDGRDSLTIPPLPDGFDPATTDDPMEVYWSYLRRTTPVSVTTDDVADDGAPGEGDDVPIRTQTVDGGHAGDDIDTSAQARPGPVQGPVIHGEGGDDRISTSPWRDHVYAGGGDDTVLSLAAEDDQDGGDQVEGGAGDDTLVGSSAGDHLVGDGGDDSIEGGAGPDELSGDHGDDELLGGPGNDRFVADDLSDPVASYRGDVDVYRGEDGDDYFYIRNDLAETAFGGPGTDWAQADRKDVLHSVEEQP